MVFSLWSNITVTKYHLHVTATEAAQLWKAMSWNSLQLFLC